jgi:hypothetical protein
MTTPRQPREARSSTAHTSDRQLRSPGSRPITLTRRRVSPKVRSIRLVWRILAQCSPGEAQEAGELGQGVQQAGDRCRVARVVAVGEGVRPLAGLGHRGLAGFGVDVVEDLPERGLDLGLGVLGHTREQVAGSVHQTPLPQAVGQHQRNRADQPWRPVGDHQQRRPQAAAHQLTQEPSPGVVALVAARCQPDQHRGALGGDPPGAQHRLGPSARVHPEVAAVQEQVLQLDPAQLAGLPGVELGLDRLADAADGRLGQRRLRPSASASAASTSRTDRPRTNPDSTSASSALVRLTPLPSSREANGWVVPRSLGRSSTTGPAVVFTVSSAWPLRYPARSRSPRT